jgi:LPXTG-site transpeptidase (sortase) family protein
MVWINDSNDPAMEAEVYDPIPAGTTYVPASITCNATGVSTTTACSYDVVNDQIVWRGTIGPDQGATNQANANNEIVIEFSVTVADGILSVENNAMIDADITGDNVIDAADGEVQVASVRAVWTADPLTLPETGFTPGIVTIISDQTNKQEYQALGDVWLEIPSLGVKTSIVGVPIVEENWDVTWLSQQAGWLAGTAFPSYSGNSVVTAHVYLPSGLPGPFVDLYQMQWDEQIIVHAFGQHYVYQVRSNQIITADNQRAVRHEELPWLTLLTCKGYNEITDSYNYRIIVRAVLIEIKPEQYH